MKFQEFYEKELKMSTFFDNFSDNRIHPQIPASHIGKSIIYMPALQFQSILQLDQMARSPVLRDLIGSNRYMVASDSTIQRVLPHFNFQPINNTIKTVYDQIVSRGLSKFTFSSGKHLKIAAVDGSGFGHFYASVVTLIGSATFPLDCHASETRGKELLTSRSTLSRLTDTLGKSWCDILVGDGLYPTEDDFSLSKELFGFDLLVKTSEQTLSIINDAKAIFSSNNPDIQSASGFDPLHNVNFKVKSISGLFWQDLDYPLTVAHVKETKINPKPDENPTEEFFAITTKTDLTPCEIREAAHARWFIENNVFKRLNSLVNSKRVYTKSIPTFTSLLLLWLIGLSLLQIFILDFEKLNWQSYYHKLRVTFKFLIRQIFISLFLLPHQQLGVT